MIKRNKLETDDKNKNDRDDHNRDLDLQRQFAEKREKDLRDHLQSIKDKDTSIFNYFSVSSYESLFRKTIWLLKLNLTILELKTLKTCPRICSSKKKAGTKHGKSIKPIIREKTKRR